MIVKKGAEFNVTSYMQEGEIVLAVEAYRWSDGAYQEGQDYWKVSGIERDVYLFSTPSTYIRDFFATTDLDDDYSTVNLDPTFRQIVRGFGVVGYLFLWLVPAFKGFVWRIMNLNRRSFKMIGEVKARSPNEALVQVVRPESPQPQPVSHRLP